MVCSNWSDQNQWTSANGSRRPSMLRATARPCRNAVSWCSTRTRRPYLGRCWATTSPTAQTPGTAVGEILVDLNAVLDGQAGLRGELGLGTVPTPTTRTSASTWSSPTVIRTPPPRRGVRPVTGCPVRTSTPASRWMPATTSPRSEPRARCSRAGQRLQDRGPLAQLDGGRGDLAADEPAAEHGDVLGRGDAVAELGGVPDGPQVADGLAVDAGQDARADAGGEQQLVVGQDRAVGQGHGPGGESSRVARTPSSSSTDCCSYQAGSLTGTEPDRPSRNSLDSGGRS